MELNNQTIYKIDETLKNSFRNIKLKDFKIHEISNIKQAEFIFDIKGINSDFHIGVDLYRILSIEELMWIIKQYLTNVILSAYGLAI